MVLGILQLTPLQLHGFRVHTENVHRPCLSGLSRYEADKRAAVVIGILQMKCAPEMVRLGQ